jgi:nitrate/nitrite-specific signal transduction histidine kinase
MDSRREVFIAIGVLAGMNLLVAFGAVGLLTRMTPAIEGILKENVRSMRAAEEVLAVLATEPQASISPQGRQRMQAALDQLRANVTESDEPGRLDTIELRWRAVLQMDPQARAPMVADVLALIATNHRAMERADAEAKRLGNAGAWAVALLGLVALLLSVVILRRLSTRLLRPLAELYQTLRAAQGGDPFRRCTTSDTAGEVHHLMHAVNELLDARLLADSSRPARHAADASTPSTRPG